MDETIVDIPSHAIKIVVVAEIMAGVQVMHVATATAHALAEVKTERPDCLCQHELNLPAASGQGIRCSYDFSRTGISASTTEVVPTMGLRRKRQEIKPKAKYLH